MNSIIEDVEDKREAKGNPPIPSVVKTTEDLISKSSPEVSTIVSESFILTRVNTVRLNNRRNVRINERG